MSYDLTPASSHFLSWGDLSILDGATAATWSAWLLHDVSWGGAAWGLFSKRNAASQQSYSIGANYNAANTFTARIYNGTTTQVNRYDVNSSAWEVGSWINVIITYESGASATNRWKFYKNGVSQAVSAVQDAAGSIPSTTAPDQWGRLNETGTSFFDGKLAHCAIWNTVVSSTDITDLAGGESPLRIKPVNLQIYWRGKDLADEIVAYRYATTTAVLSTDEPSVKGPRMYQGSIVGV